MSSSFSFTDCGYFQYDHSSNGGLSMGDRSHLHPSCTRSSHMSSTPVRAAALSICPPGMAKMDAGFTNERWRRLPPPLPDDGAVSTSRSGCAPTCCGAHWTDDKEDVAKEEAEEIVGTIIIVVVVVTTRAVSTIIIMRRKGSRARMKMKGRDQDVSHTTELRVPPVPVRW